MPKKTPPSNVPIPEPHEVPAPESSGPPRDVTSPKADHLRDRMKLAAKPNAGEPLAHRNRAKAGRKG